MRQNLNNQSHWNTKWLEESKNTWRQYPEIIKRILKLIKPHSSLIDLGCGNGVFLNKVKQNIKDMKLMGLDMSSVAIQQLKEFYNISGIVSKLPEIPYPIIDNSFDYVVMMEIVEHVDDEKELMNNAFRILKPGGKIIVTAPSDNTKEYRKFIEEKSSEHVRWYDENRFLNLLNYYGKNPFIEKFIDENTRNGVLCKGEYFLGGATK